MLLFEFLGENRRNLKDRGRVAEERSIFSWKRGNIERKKPAKGSRKLWEEFA